MDDFKNYLQHRADKLDFDEPGEVVWTNIASKKMATPSAKLFTFVRLAAAACFILLATFAVLFLHHPAKEVAKNTVRQQTKITSQSQQQLQKPVPVQQSQEKLLARQPFEKQQEKVVHVKNRLLIQQSQALAANENQHKAPLLQSIENSFSQLVSMQLSKVRSLPLYAEGPEYYSEFKRQFQQLEEDEKEVKKQISKQGLINENLDHLISVCQQKLNLLKMLQNEINKTNNQYKQNNHSDSTSKISYINI